MDIRDARDADLPLLADIALRAKAHWGYAPPMLESMREELTWSREALMSMVFRVAELQGVPVGFHALEPLSGGDVELEALFVEPAQIGRGRGRKLMIDAMACARRLGGKSMIIQSDPFAERFYLEGGAVRIGERPSASIPGRMLPLLHLALTP